MASGAHGCICDNLVSRPAVGHPYRKRGDYRQNHRVWGMANAL